jgi:hypothetical protein
MAAETGKTNKLVMHLDKIAYASALVLGLFIVLIPLFATTEINKVSRVLPDLQNQVAEKLRQPPEEIKIPDLKKIVRDQWEVPSSPGRNWIPPWTVDARPAVVKLTKVMGKQKAEHAAAEVSKISYLRDPKKQQVYLKIEVTLGALKGAKFTKIILLRADVSDKGEVAAFSAIADLKAESPVYEDYAVEAGKKYAYQVSTEVGIEGDSELAPDEKKKDSAPLVMTAAVPFDYAIYIQSATGPNPTTGAAASCFGEVSFWDYTAAKLVKVSKPKWAEKEKFGTKDRYQIFRIEDGQIQINDMAKLGADKAKLTTADNKRPVDLPPELTPASASAPPAAEEEKEKPPAPAKPEEKKAATPKKTDEKKTGKETKPAATTKKKRQVK